MESIPRVRVHLKVGPPHIWNCKVFASVPGETGAPAWWGWEAGRGLACWEGVCLESREGRGLGRGVGGAGLAAFEAQPALSLPALTPLFSPTEFRAGGRKDRGNRGGLEGIQIQDNMSCLLEQ